MKLEQQIQSLESDTENLREAQGEKSTINVLYI